MLQPPPLTPHCPSYIYFNNHSLQSTDDTDSKCDNNSTSQQTGRKDETNRCEELEATPQNTGTDSNNNGNIC